MKQLEDELGVTLFVRSKNHLTLNETGLRAAEYARQVLLADQDFEARVRAYDRSLRTLSIGYCAPVPQTVLTPIINNLFSGMTISSDMKEDSHFEEGLKQGLYQLAVLHYKPEDEALFSKKCGSESLYISLPSGSPLSFYPELHLKDLDGMNILLLSQIGFWSMIQHTKTPNAHYLTQIEETAFTVLATDSEYPVFSSSHFIRRGETLPGRVNVALADPECHTDYYLVCLASERKKFERLFRTVSEDLIK